MGGRKEDSSEAKHGGVMGAKLWRHLLDAPLNTSPSVKDMVSADTINDGAEKNSPRVTTSNYLCLGGRREDSSEAKQGGVMGAK